MRVEPEVGRAGGLRRDGGRIGIEPHDAGAVCRQPIEQHRLGHQHRRAGVFQHEGEPLGRVAGIERQIGAARLEDAHEPDEHRGRAFDAEAHHDLGADAEPAQVMRQLIGAPVELAIGEAHILMHHRDGVRRLGRLLGEQLRQGGGHSRTGGVVPRVQDGDALLGGEDVETSDRTLGSRNRSLQQADESFCQRLDAGAIEQVGGVFHHPADPRRGAVRGAFFAHAHRQVELRARRRNPLEAAAQSIELELHLGGVLQRQHHLEQRMPRQRPRRVDDLHQTLKRQVLVAVGREVARPNPCHQLTEARIARRVGAQHQRVDEEPDQVVERAVGAPRDRAADRDVAACPQPRQQRRKSGL